MDDALLIVLRLSRKMACLIWISIGITIDRPSTNNSISNPGPALAPPKSRTWHSLFIARDYALSISIHLSFVLSSLLCSFLAAEMNT